MLHQQKTKTLIAIGVALFALFILASGLSQLKLQPGEKTNLGVDSSLGGNYGQTFNGLFFIYLVRWLYGFCFLILIGYFIYMLLTPERRKKLFRFLAWAVPLLVLGLGMLLLVQSLSRSNSSKNNIVLQTSQATTSATSEPVATFTPNTSPTIVIIASILIAVILCGLLAFLLIRMHKEKSEPANPLMQLADEAQNALDALQNGVDLKNTVLRCYFEMNRILVEQRGLNRKRFMTPREFENELLAHGMPEDSIHNLTSLFEEVRYGSQLPGKREEETAVASLSAIIAYCKEEG